MKPLNGTRWFANYFATRVERRLQIGDYFWLFVLGVNNSGTTMLTRILQTHPLVRALPTEGQFLTNVFPVAENLGVARRWTERLDAFRWLEDHDPKPALWAKLNWAHYYPCRPGILLEKSPPNTLRSRWLQRNFQPSRFLAIVRSPYSVCEGIRRRESCDIESAARHWTVANECLFADMEHLKHCFLLRYEDFCDCPAEYLGKIQSFLDLPTAFQTNALQTVSAHSIEGRSTGIQNLNAKSMSGLSPEDIKRIDMIAGPLSRRLGYDLR